jgi:hypothetical protein
MQTYFCSYVYLLIASVIKGEYIIKTAEKYVSYLCQAKSLSWHLCEP